MISYRSSVFILFSSLYLINTIFLIIRYNLLFSKCTSEFKIRISSVTSMQKFCFIYLTSVLLVIKWLFNWKFGSLPFEVSFKKFWKWTKEFSRCFYSVEVHVFVLGIIIPKFKWVHQESRRKIPYYLHISFSSNACFWTWMGQKIDSWGGYSIICMCHARHIHFLAVKNQKF